MKQNEIREKSTAELTRLTASLKEEIFRLRFRHGAGQLKETSGIGKARHDLARVLTELSAREAAQSAKGDTSV